MKKILYFLNLLLITLSVSGCVDFTIPSRDPYFPSHGVLVYQERNYSYPVNGKFAFEINYLSDIKLETIHTVITVPTSYSIEVLYLENPPYVVHGEEVYFREDLNINEMYANISSKGDTITGLKFKDLIADDYLDYPLSVEKAIVFLEYNISHNYIDFITFQIDEYPNVVFNSDVIFWENNYYLISDDIDIALKVSDKLLNAQGTGKYSEGVKKYWDDISQKD